MSKKDWDVVLSKLEEVIDEIRSEIKNDYKFVEWHIYDNPLHRRINFDKFRETNFCLSYSKSRYEIEIFDNVLVKFVMLDDLVGVEFGKDDAVYLDSKFNKESAQYILSRMR